jgi:chromosome segregation ATPase
MSEERFDRLESQLTQVIQGMTVIQQNMSVMQENMSVMQENMSAMQNRIDSIEGTLLVAMRSGFDSLQTAIDDLDYDLNVAEIQGERNARLTRKLNQRVTAIEARLDDRG